MPMNHVTLDGIELDDEVGGTGVAVGEWSVGRGDAARIVQLVDIGVLFVCHLLERR
jgi:hypothetical protein